MRWLVLVGVLGCGGEGEQISEPCDPEDQETPAHCDVNEDGIPLEAGETRWLCREASDGTWWTVECVCGGLSYDTGCANAPPDL